MNTNIVTPSNWTVGREGNQITGIVLHTMVGTTAGAYARFNNPTSQVSVHYGVSLDGSVDQWVADENTAWQAGDWQVNLNTIGIEHEDDGNYNDAVRTPQLYESSAQLVASLCKEYDIPCDTSHIFKHCDVIDTTAFPGGTSCPDGLDINKIISMATSLLGGSMNTPPVNEGDIINMGNFVGWKPGQDYIKAWIGQDWKKFMYDFTAQPVVLEAMAAKFGTGAQEKLAQIKAIVG